MVEDETTRADFRDTAYTALRMIMGKGLGPIWEELDWSKDIDWNLIREAKAIAGT